MSKYNQDILGIIAIFEKEFNSSFKNLKYKNKNYIYEFFSSYYRRWLHSSIVENTNLTPFNVITKEKDFIICPMPTKQETKNTNFKINKYSLEYHPVISDLKILIKNCYPMVNLESDYSFPIELQKKILDLISIYDVFYLEYLIILAFELKLLKKFLSIYSIKAQVSKEFTKFFELNTKEILNLIVDASIKISIFNLSKMLIFDSFSITYEFMYSLLKNPITCEEIYNFLYSQATIDIASLMDINQELEFEVDELLEVIMNDAFYFGVIIDKYFFTIFGYYLKLINPQYFIPFRASNELDLAVKSLKEIDSLELVLFSPCSVYNLTSLGIKLFNKDDEIKLLNLPNPLILELINSEFKLNDELKNNIEPYIDFDNENIYNNIIYIVKLTSNHNKKFWKQIEVFANMKLDDLYMEICYEFNIDMTNLNYIYFLDNTKNLFSAIIYKYNDKKNKEYTLKDLLKKENESLILSLKNIINPFEFKCFNEKIKTFDISLELIKIKKVDFKKTYPNLLKSSKSFKKIED